MFKRLLSLFIIPLIFSCTNLYTIDVLEEKPNNSEKIVIIGDRFGLSTGFFITEDGKIVATSHGTKGNITVGSEGKTYIAKVLERNPVLDIALIQIQKKSSPVNLTRVVPEVSDTIYLVGHPRPQLLTSVGIMGKRWRYRFEVHAMVLPGNSGSPVFNEEGYVFGMIQSILVHSNERYISGGGITMDIILDAFEGDF